MKSIRSLTRWLSFHGMRRSLEPAAGVLPMSPVYSVSAAISSWR
jgi:hypothetical protein